MPGPNAQRIAEARAKAGLAGGAQDQPRHGQGNGRDLVPLNTQIESIQELIESQKEVIFQCLPRHVTIDRIERTFLTSLRKNPTLLGCSQVSLLAAITEAATLGLETDGVLGHAYIVPFKGEAQLLPGYKGLIDLCRRSGNVSVIFAHVVRPDDLFDYELGLDPKLYHKPAGKPHGGLFTATYAVCHLRDGGKQFEVMTFDEIEDHKKKHAKGWQRSDSPWSTDREAMHKKTVLRRLVKMLPVSPEIQRLVARDEIFEADSAPSPVVSSLADRLAPKREAIDVATEPRDESFQPSPEDEAGGWEPEESEATA